ncbi:protein kinase [Sphaerisporangium sp. NPDC049002]|uniref:serine/threonine-protein kinase n=1 Tax=unclassified Sphaerisporangium TaxID=2630420 RepID=UPI0033F56D26
MNVHWWIAGTLLLALLAASAWPPWQNILTRYERPRLLGSVIEIAPDDVTPYTLTRVTAGWCVVPAAQGDHMDSNTWDWHVPGYTEIRDLGTGASGRVVMACDDIGSVLVAIKYLSSDLRADPAFISRFRHEAPALGLLDGTFTVRFHEYFESAQGHAAVVMELVDGVSLRTLLRSEEPTGPEVALVLLKRSLSGLAAAHANGIVHRDVKPENILVTGGGESKLGDFGIAVHSGDGIAGAGTPPYMAPEQWSGSPASPATDLYAAGVVFFECLTGIRPFHARSIAALAHLHQTAEPPIRQVPPALRTLAGRGLAKRAADRPESAEAFLAELESVARDGYGSGWEERGRRRLASLTGLLADHEPSPRAFPAGVTPPRPRLARSPAFKMASGVLGCAMAVAVTTVVVRSLGDTDLQANTTSLTPRSPSSDTGLDGGPPDSGDRADLGGTAGRPAAGSTPPAAEEDLPGGLDASKRPGTMRRVARKPSHASMSDPDKSHPLCADGQGHPRTPAPSPTPNPSPDPAPSSVPAPSVIIAPAETASAEPTALAGDEVPE